MDSSGILPKYKGIAVHDCWASYWKYADVVHAVCCAHLLRELNPIPEKEPGKRGRKGKGKIRSLIERLFDYEDEVCLFTKNFNVPFDNNQAERDVRMIKVKTKVAGCFRTLEGAQNFMTIMSYLGTAKKQGISPMKALIKSLCSEGDFIFA